MTKKTVGLIVNPVAGLGGRVGLKGSDGLSIQQRARELGAVSRSSGRATEALQQIASFNPDADVITYPAEMGARAARAAGFDPLVVGSIDGSRTTAEDTRRAAKHLRDLNVDIILFAGGDGTARDIHSAIEQTVPAMGIPAGVKIHSAVFGVNPVSAGELVAAFLGEENVTLKEAEVIDLDEVAYREGDVTPRLFGYLKIPYRRQLVQARKAPSQPTEEEAQINVSMYLLDKMEEDVLYLIGPGTTTRPILASLGFEKTLIGVDAIRNKQLVAADVNEGEILSLIGAQRAKIVVTPVGGQGFIFGRGNQQISPTVIDHVGRENIIVVSTMNKIASLKGQPLLVDTGERNVDEMLSGYVRVVTGYGERIIYRVGGKLSG